MQLDFAPFSYGRPGYGLAVARQVNLFIEPSPLEAAQRARLPRPGLVVSRSVGDGPVNAMYQAAGVYSGDLFTVSGEGVYRNSDFLGSIPFAPFASIASSDTQVVFVQGGEAWCYDGTWAQIAVPDEQPVQAVAYIGARFYYLIKDSGVWYFSVIDDAKTIDGLAFATADAAPDPSVNVAILGDQVVFFGRSTVEFWTQTGDQDAPLIRSQGSKYDKGCIAPATVVPLDNRLFWVGSDLKVYATGSVPQRISSHSVEALLSECERPEECTAFPVSFQGHDFYILNIPGKGTFAYQLELGDSEFAWAQWSSWERDTFRGRCSVNVDGVTYLGDGVSGRVFTLEADAHQDDGLPIERVVTAVAPRGACNTLELDCAVGIGPTDGTVPQVDLRYSDNSRIFGMWKTRPLGSVGQYDRRVRWSRLGFIKNKRVIEVRSTADARVVFTAIRMNEP